MRCIILPRPHSGHLVVRHRTIGALASDALGVAILRNGVNEWMQTQKARSICVVSSTCVSVCRSFFVGWPGSPLPGNCPCAAQVGGPGHCPPWVLLAKRRRFFSYRAHQDVGGALRQSPPGHRPSRARSCPRMYVFAPIRYTAVFGILPPYGGRNTPQLETFREGALDDQGSSTCISQLNIFILRLLLNIDLIPFACRVARLS